ncbi:MAG: fibronectin type III domain-containing protein, partial [Bacteroidota bacterium]
MRTKFLGAFLVFMVLGIYPTAIFADTEAPEITDVQVVENSDTSITVTWTTDEEADSLINYGLTDDYGIVRDPDIEQTVHSITIDDLEPGRVYYFRVVSSDEDGNQGISADYKIQLSGDTESDGVGENVDIGPGQINEQVETETVTDPVVQSQTAEEIIERIQQISDPQQIREIQNELVKAVEGITEDLTIIGPPTVIPETSMAIVQWTTDRPATSEVRFSSADQYIPGGAYAFSQSSTNEPTTDHEVRLIGLEAFTEYHFQVASTDEFSITGTSRDFT